MKEHGRPGPHSIQRRLQRAVSAAHASAILLKRHTIAEWIHKGEPSNSTAQDSSAPQHSCDAWFIEEDQVTRFLLQYREVSNRAKVWLAGLIKNRTSP